MPPRKPNGRSIRSTPTRKRYGLHPKAMPKSVAWMAECDYLDQLDDDQLDYLARFNDEVANAAFNHPDPLYRNDTDEGIQARRAIYRAKNAANVDALENARTMGRLVFPDAPIPGRGRSTSDGSRWDFFAPVGSGDVSPDTTPGYLNSAAYKQAVAEYRAHLPTGPRAKFVETPEYHAAKSALERFTREQQTEDFQSPDYFDLGIDGPDGDD